MDKRIAIYNLYPQYRNYALDKVRTFYTSQGAEVEEYFALRKYDEIWVSSIFAYNRSLIPPECHIGGSGVDLRTELPAEIEAVNPRLNYGFTTRGCIRKCEFCIVPEKEGRIRHDRDLLDLWDGTSRDIVLYDNNILAMPEHFEQVCSDARQNGIRIDFNQGLDYRLLAQEHVDLLKTIRHHELRFAFDSVTQFSSVERTIDLLQRNGINRCLWYVLCGFDTSLEEDLIRLNYLRERNQNAYVMRYNSGRTDIRLTALARWANQHHIFYGMTWVQFLDVPEHQHYKRHIQAIGV
ncbi:hypothetical protein CVH13_00060 [Dehalococcoides mccartyi]|uniref:Radical SAM protein n=1 Tax=Dehalococcoides mccartyi TaxID=61435 RepID=A0A2J1E0M3_9CHLR|nr:hypothetical protein CVH13_00060 [Dehalococcoides mccartyi]